MLGSKGIYGEPGLILLQDKIVLDMSTVIKLCDFTCVLSQDRGEGGAESLLPFTQALWGNHIMCGWLAASTAIPSASWDTCCAPSGKYSSTLPDKHGGKNKA